MNTAEQFCVLQGHIYQCKKQNFDRRTLQIYEILKLPLFTGNTQILPEFSIIHIYI